jgi:hypothetical protein
MIIVDDIIIHKVLKIIRVGRDFFILTHIRREDVVKVRKCNHHISIPNTKDGTMIRALADQAANSTIL